MRELFDESIYIHTNIQGAYIAECACERENEQRAVIESNVFFA